MSSFSDRVPLSAVRLVSEVPSTKQATRGVADMCFSICCCNNDAGHMMCCLQRMFRCVIFKCVSTGDRCTEGAVGAHLQGLRQRDAGHRGHDQGETGADSFGVPFLSAGSGPEADCARTSAVTPACVPQSEAAADAPCPLCMRAFVVSSQFSVLGSRRRIACPACTLPRACPGTSGALGQASGNSSPAGLQRAWAGRILLTPQGLPEREYSEEVCVLGTGRCREEGDLPRPLLQAAVPGRVRGEGSDFCF